MDQIVLEPEPKLLDQVPSKLSCRRATSYYTTVRGLDILFNVIVSGYVAFYQITNFSWIIFNCSQNVFVGRSLATLF